MTRADRITGLSVQTVKNADFDMSFERNPITGNLKVLTNEQAVGQGIQNAILTNNGERWAQPQFGSKALFLNFEFDDPITLDLLQATITDTVVNFCKRAALIGVQVSGDPDRYEAAAQVTFRGASALPVTVQVPLNRVR